MKRMGLMSYSIIMFLILISLFLFSQTVAVLSYQFAESSKYGMSFIAELLMVLVLLPFLLFTKNKFALLYKKENFFKSLLMSLPVLIFSTVYLFIGFVFVIFVQKDLNIYNFEEKSKFSKAVLMKDPEVRRIIHCPTFESQARAIIEKEAPEGTTSDVEAFTLKFKGQKK